MSDARAAGHELSAINPRRRAYAAPRGRQQPGDRHRLPPADEQSSVRRAKERPDYVIPALCTRRLLLFRHTRPKLPQSWLEVGDRLAKLDQSQPSAPTKRFEGGGPSD